LVLIFTRRNKITKRKYKYKNRIHIHNMEQENKQWTNKFLCNICGIFVRQFRGK
jgi:hypothetical protein